MEKTVSENLAKIISDDLQEQDCQELLVAFEKNTSLQKELAAQLYIDGLLKLELDKEYSSEGLTRKILERIDAAEKTGELPLESTESSEENSDTAIKQLSSQMSSMMQGGSRKPGIGLWLSVAAILIIMATASVVWQTKPGRVPLEAVVATTVQGAWVMRSGRWVPVTQHMPLFENDRVETGAAGGLLIKYGNEDTQIELQKESHIEFFDAVGLTRANVGKLIYLKQGGISCEVASQPSGRPLVIMADHAEVEVVGTNFQCQLSGSELIGDHVDSQKGQDPSLRLSVFEGVVRLTRLSDKAQVDVVGGQYAVAQKDVVLQAQDIPAGSADPSLSKESKGEGEVNAPVLMVPPGYEMGSVVFEDDFDNGLGKWELLIGKDFSRLKPAGNKVDEMVEKTISLDLRPYFEPNFSDDIKDRRHGVRIHWPKGDVKSLSRLISLRAKLPILEDAFSVKWYVVHAHAEELHLTPFPGASMVEEKVHFNSRNTIPSVFLMRWDCVPVGRDKDGSVLLETRRYVSSTRGNDFIEERLLDTQIIVCKDRRINLTVKNGAYELARIEVRRLLKK